MHVHLRITSQRNPSALLLLLQAPSCLSSSQLRQLRKSPQQRNFSRDTFPFPHQRAAQSSLFIGQSFGFVCLGAIFSQEEWGQKAGLRGSTRATPFFFTVLSGTFWTFHTASVLFLWQEKARQGTRMGPFSGSSGLFMSDKHLEDTNLHGPHLKPTPATGLIIKWIILGNVWFGRQWGDQAGHAHGKSLRDVCKCPYTAVERWKGCSPHSKQSTEACLPLKTQHLLRESTVPFLVDQKQVCKQCYKMEQPGTEFVKWGSLPFRRHTVDLFSHQSLTISSKINLYS